MGMRRVVWDREGEEGMRVIQRKGVGREEGKGREGKGREEGRRKMTWRPPKQNSWIRHCWSQLSGHCRCGVCMALYGIARREGYIVSYKRIQLYIGLYTYAYV
jgi:hypothetical protein